MNGGIKLDIKIGSINVMRVPYLKIGYTRGTVIDTAYIHIADTKAEAYGKIKKDNIVSLTYGYAGGKTGIFSGVVSDCHAVGKDTLGVVAVSEGIRLSKSLIKESYNDESSVEIIKRLASFVGLGIGKVAIPDVQIPHIIFNNIPVYTAINHVYATLEKLGHNMAGKEYWVHNGLFYAGDFSISGETSQVKTAINLIQHSYITKGYAFAETPLIAGLHHSQDFILEDTRRGISGTFRTQSVTHEITEGKARTKIGYYYDK